MNATNKLKEWLGDFRTSALLIFNCVWGIISLAGLVAVFGDKAKVHEIVNGSGIIVFLPIALFCLTPLAALAATVWKRSRWLCVIAQIFLSTLMIVMLTYLVVVLFFATKGIGVVLLLFTIVAYRTFVYIRRNGRPT